MIFKNEAKWIAAPEEQIPAPLFRKEIHLREKPVSMKLTVTAVGAHVVYFDGARVDDAILNPCYSDNRKTVYVNTVELEKMPEAGRHALGVVLGRSRSAMKTPNTWGWHTPPWDRQRKFILQLEADYADGSTEFFHSGPGWTCACGPVRYDCLYTGETHDANHGHPGWNLSGFESDKWFPAMEAAPPAGTLRMQASPPIVPIREIRPSSG
jgi:alpha-L-rhamnosidase